MFSQAVILRRTSSSVSLMRGASDPSKTPMTDRVAEAALIMGPRILNTLLIPRLFLRKCVRVRVRARACL